MNMYKIAEKDRQSVCSYLCYLILLGAVMEIVEPDGSRDRTCGSAPFLLRALRVSCMGWEVLSNIFNCHHHLFTIIIIFIVLIF